MRVAVLLACSACATVAQAPTSPATAAAKPPPSEAELLAPRLAALTEHAHAVETARDDALWAFWLGAPGPAADPWAGHEVLLEDASLADVRRARELSNTDVDALEELIVGERVGRAVHDAEAAVANLEASARFTFEGREVLYRELGTLLSAEKSAPRRQSLWAASLPVAQQLSAALDRRDAAQDEALAAVKLTRESFSRLLRRTEPEVATAWAVRFLEATALRWKDRLAAQHVGSRADFPSAFKPPANLDAAFPKARIAERGTQLLAGVGLYGLPQLTLELTDSPKKQPLPLTVSGVRLSFKPRGGWRDQQALLSELGRALAMRHGARRQVVEATAVLFGSLAWNAAWLQDQGVPAAQVSAAVETGADATLLSLRRAAGGVLGTPEAFERALALPDNPARARLETEPLLAQVDALRAASLAFALGRHLEVVVGSKWWASAAAADVLKSFWSGGALPEPVREFGATGESLLAALGAPAHGGVGVSFSPSR